MAQKMTQWEYEKRIFFKGLRGGKAVQLDTHTIGVEWLIDQSTHDTDPRFITYTRGDGRLRDDHNVVQHSPALSVREVREIEGYISGAISR